MTASVEPGPARVPEVVTAALAIWSRVERLLAIVTFSAIGVLMMYDVILRELVSPVLFRIGLDARPLLLVGSQKIGVYLMIAGAFVGFTLATAMGTQLVPRIGFSWVPRRWDAAMNRAADFVSAAFLGCATYYAIVFVASSAQAGLMTTSGVDLPVWMLQSVIPFGFASAAARYLCYGVWPGTRPVPPEFQE